MSKDKQEDPILSRRRLWPWHPHVWLTLLIVLILIWISIKLVS